MKVQAPREDGPLQLFVAIQARLDRAGPQGQKRRRVSSAADMELPNFSSSDCPATFAIDASPSQLLEMALTRVAEMESVTSTLTQRVNQAYFALGKAYVRFGKHAFAHCPPPDSTAFHGLVFGSATVAMRAMAAGSASRCVSEAGLKKKLERARKFWIVVNCFGERALELVDLLCVSRLDKVSFCRLRQMAQTLSSLRMVADVGDADHLHRVELPDADDRVQATGEPRDKLSLERGSACRSEAVHQKA